MQEVTGPLLPVTLPDGDSRRSQFSWESSDPQTENDVGGPLHGFDVGKMVNKEEGNCQPKENL